MNKTSGKFRTFCEVAFCFITSALIAFIALNIGLKTEPGKILPEGISMRSGEMSHSILKGIELSMDDIELIRSGRSASGTWRLLSFVHTDLFFYLALILPQASAKAVLMAGYYLRFGLCSAAMYYFLSKHIKLSRMFSALLAVMYAFSSQLVFTAQFASVMNMALMMPVVMSAFDSYLQKRTWNAYVISGIASFLLIFSGGFGAMVGMPVMILIGLLMCISLYGSFKIMITSWLKLLSTLVFGFGLSAVFTVPGLLSMDFDINVAESFKNASVTYTVFETLRGMFLLRSGGIYQNAAPLFYIGILTVAGVIAFAVNERIPLRLKAASAVIISVIHITCCSSFVNEIISLFGASPLMNSARLIGMEAVLFLIAGIGLKNARGLSRGDHIATCLIPLFFLIISGNSTSGTSLASPVLISTFIGIILEAALIYAYAKDRLTLKKKIFAFVFILLFVGINAAFIMFNNSIQKKSASEYFKNDNGSGYSESLIIDDDMDLPVLRADEYLIVPADLRNYEPGSSVIDDMNYISMQISGRNLLEEIFLTTSDKKESRQAGYDSYLLDAGPNTLSFSPFAVEEGERLFLYCNADNGAAIDILDVNGIVARAYTGPFFTELMCGSGEVKLDLIIDSENEDSCRISLYKLDETALADMKALSGEINGTEFLMDVSSVNGICTLIVPYSYADSEIRIDGKTAYTFELCGRLSAVFLSNNTAGMEVSVGSKASGTGPCMLMSIAAAFCLIAIPILQRYNEKKKVTGEGTETNA